MKQRSTTPVSSSFVTKATIVATATLFVMATPIGLLSPGASATDRFQEKINQLQGEINKYQSSVNKLRGKVNTLQDELNVINNEVGSLQAKIAKTRAVIEQLNDQIKKNTAKIAQNRDAMGTIIADLYVDGDISPLEMLASSKNIGDFVDKQTYQTSARDTMNRTIKEINDLQKRLENDKKQVEKQYQAQKLQEGELGAKQAQQQTLLTKTKGEEAGYKNLVADRKQALANEQAARQAFLQSLQQQAAASSGGGVSGGSIYNNNVPISAGAFQMRNITPLVACGGGYPLCGGMNTVVDKYGLYNRQCVSYSAWRAEQMGRRVGNFAGMGHAYQWPLTAQRMGAAVNTTPAIGAVAVLPNTSPVAPGFGHTMNVEAILPDGWIRVSQYNFGGTGLYNTMEIRPAGVTFVHFPSR